MINKQTVIGHIGSISDMKTIGSTENLRFSVAVTEKWKDRNSGEKKEHTEWIDVVAWGGLAKFIKQYCAKGDLVYVEGSNRTDKWQDKDTQQEKRRTYCRADVVKLLKSKGDKSQQNHSSEKYDDFMPEEKPPF